MNTTDQTFAEYLRGRIEHGPLAADELLASLLPLFEQVRKIHERGLVAPLAGLNDLKVSSERCWFMESAARAPQLNKSAISKIDREESKALEITGRQKIEDGAHGGVVAISQGIGKRGEEIRQPVFLPGYIAWEHEVEHHDPLTDIFSLGLLTASLACGVDLSEDEDLSRFVASRSNLFQLNAHLHPVINKAVVRMTEPQQGRRAQDLPSLITALRYYREQATSAQFSFQSLRGFKEASPTGRKQLIEQRLRDRLFELSRRNRLLYFRTSMQTLNLTVGSVPLQLSYENISPDALCTWQGDFEKHISNGDAVPLGRYLRFEDAPYMPGVLDQIRNQETRDRNEFGFSQLRLVLAFLRWHNLKEAKEERITSPLVLLAVKLEKKKGIRDSYTLTPQGTEAEINPVLRHFLRQLYGLQLPEFIDLSQTNLRTFYELLQRQIQASEPGITLRMIDRPQIKLVHERARARLESYRRRSRLTGRGIRQLANIDYSYSRENFHPLGLQLFLKRVKPSPSPFQGILGERPQPRTMNISPEPPPASGTDSPVRERDMYVLQEDHDANPYLWDFDLCSLTLGNFNYRKMSLVRDYNTLIEQPIENAAFDAVFSLHPRKAEGAAPAPLGPEESFQIVPSDPTQMAAITRARSGQSYIIQGPPGTGKSQTITNLIADYVARGKRVLFVCQKRAAIDVVYYRLKQRGIDALCCLIHDSQEDKKAFIMDLKVTYEKYLSAQDTLQQIQQQRHDIVASLKQEIGALDRFSSSMSAVDPRDGVSLRQIYARLIELADSLPQVDDALAEKLPGYAAWQKFGGAVQRLAQALQDTKMEPVFSRHGARHLARARILAEKPIQGITAAIERVEPLIASVSAALKAMQLSEYDDPASLDALVEYARRVQLLAERDLLPLIDQQNPLNRELRQAAKQLDSLRSSFNEAAAKTVNWREKIPASELSGVSDLAASVEGKLLRFLMPDFWKVRRILKSRYNFRAHIVAPKWTRILEELNVEYKAVDALQKAISDFKNVWRVDDPQALLETLSVLHAREASLHSAQRALRQRLLDNSAGKEAVAGLLALNGTLQALIAGLKDLLNTYSGRRLSQLTAILQELRSLLPALPDLLASLTEMVQATETFYSCLCEQPWTPAQSEAGILLGSLIHAYRRDRSLPRSDGRGLDQHAERLKQSYDASMIVNAAMVVQSVHARFLQRVNISSLPAAQLTSEQKELKRQYIKGRRELEHEFGKVMRYRSIRDLSCGETGVVIADLKPVWLMSPLSVADTLPLAEGRFDVIIFDEASQIPLEEAIPSIHRGAQIIVVGDEMQLPPTDFFSARGDEDETLVVEEHGEKISYELNSESFLTQSAANLPSTMLGWHYRSRSESLISFSNAAFYNRKLLTIPDVQMQLQPRPIEVNGAESAVANLAAALERPVSFHYLPNGIYEDRTNPAEAAYIARFVQAFLKQKTGMSLGVVAFSEAQQGEIENALHALAGDDSEFREMLDAEFIREENDQFCGLFVKNLENVQGDERDVIILSVCYGFDRQKKMLMNFGPINKIGGEKRLNVVFSRARRHMVLVSSIRHSAITNEYNDGANCLRRYLEYADALSSGQFDNARRVLSTLSQSASSPSTSESSGSVAKSIAAALRKAGYRVDLNVGESYFRCDLAIARSGDEAFRLGVLIDKDDGAGALERSVLRPQVLNGFGWRVACITAKDWHHDPKSVLAMLERHLENRAPDA